MACPDADTFNQLVADTLGPDARARVVDHAGTCDPCRELMSALLGLAAGTMVSTPGGAVSVPVGAAPAQVDRYVIDRLLGAGAMGVVYAAHDPSLDRAVAIKLLRGAGSAARLTREAQMLAKLHHPNVVAVYDVGEHEGQTFVAMALVDGENLRAWLAKPRQTAEIVRVIRDAGRGLAAAHAAGLIHRDLKPDNIFVAHDGSVQVGDFGLARAEGERDVAAGGDGPLELTMTGMVLGTPAYMAPEHAAGAPTAASDQFSLCVTAWEALFGERPFAATNYAELQQAVMAGTIRKPTDDRDVPARVRDQIERGLRAEPSDRFPSVDALVDALAPPRRKWPWVAAVGLVGAAIATTVVVTHSQQRADPAVACAAHARDLDDVQPQLAGSATASAHEALDNYERDWLALRHDACMTPRPGGDPRIRCLDRAHDALRELVSVLPTIDPDRVYPAAVALPSLGDCKSALAEVSMATTVAGDLLLGKIENASVRIVTRRVDPKATLDALAKEADALGYEPAIIRVAITRADLYARSGETEAAEQTLHGALTIAESHHDDRAVAQIATLLAEISIRSSKLDQGRTMIELGAAALARAGGDTDIEIAITSARAMLASAAGDHAAAIELVTKVIASMTARRGAHSIEVAALYMMLAREYSDDGRVKESADAMAKADFGQIDAVGADMVRLGQKILEANSTGEVARGIELSQQYVAMARKLGDPELEIEAATALASSYEFARDQRMMVESYREVLALLDKQPNGGPHEQRGSALEGLGTALVELHRSAEAVEPLRQAIAENEKGGSVFDDPRASSSITLARALLDLGKSHEARVLLEPILHLLVNNPASKNVRRGGAEFRMAQALWEDGGTKDRARALALADDADRDYAASLELLKASPESLKGGIRLRIEELHAWRKLHH